MNKFSEYASLGVWQQMKVRRHLEIFAFPFREEGSSGYHVQQLLC